MLCFFKLKKNLMHAKYLVLKCDCILLLSCLLSVVKIKKRFDMMAIFYYIKKTY